MCANLPAMVRLVRATDPEFDAALELRRRVFVEEQGVPLDEERDPYDLEAEHALAYGAGGDGTRLLGTARLVPNGKIGRVAVSREARGQGLGLELMRCLEERARQRALPEVFLDAQLQVLGFYERQGYVAEGEIFLDAGIQHRRMRKLLQ